MEEMYRHRGGQIAEVGMIRHSTPFSASYKLIPVYNIPSKTCSTETGQGARKGFLQKSPSMAEHTGHLGGESSGAQCSGSEVQGCRVPKLSARGRGLYKLYDHVT